MGRKKKIVYPVAWEPGQHPESFTGIPVHDPSTTYLKNPILCPVCQGHGKWNTGKNAMHGYYELRGCAQCNGWGWVEGTSVDATCVHEMEPTYDFKPMGSHDHGYKCKKCGVVKVYDSSD